MAVTLAAPAKAGAVPRFQPISVVAFGRFIFIIGSPRPLVLHNEDLNSLNKPVKVAPRAFSLDFTFGNFCGRCPGRHALYNLRAAGLVGKALARGRGGPTDKVGLLDENVAQQELID